MPSCRFSTDINYYNEKTGEYGPYLCPEEKEENILNSNLCIFHDKNYLKEKVNVQNLIRELSKKLTKSEPLICIGYYLPDFSFENLHFDKSVNFYGAQFTKEANFSGAQFTKWANFSECQFAESANFYGAQFFKEADFFGAKVKEKADFTGAQFTESANFSGGDCPVGHSTAYCLGWTGGYETGFNARKTDDESNRQDDIDNSDNDD